MSANVILPAQPNHHAVARDVAGNQLHDYQIFAHGAANTNAVTRLRSSLMRRDWTMDRGQEAFHRNSTSLQDEVHADYAGIVLQSSIPIFARISSSTGTWVAIPLGASTTVGSGAPRGLGFEKAGRSTGTVEQKLNFPNGWELAKILKMSLELENDEEFGPYNSKSESSTVVCKSDEAHSSLLAASEKSVEC